MPKKVLSEYEEKRHFEQTPEPEPVDICMKSRDEQQAHIRRELDRGKFSFFLRGSKLKGSWALVRMKKENEWLLIKHKDRFVDEERDVTEQGQSALTGLTIEDLK